MSNLLPRYHHNLPIFHRDILRASGRRHVARTSAPVLGTPAGAVPEFGCNTDGEVS